MRYRYIIVSLFFISSINLSQDVLYDDESDLHGPWIDYHWSNILDTLIEYGVSVHLTSEEGWENISQMDMIWLQSFITGYTSNERDIIQTANRHGKPLLIGVTGHDTLIRVSNELLADPAWDTDLSIADYDFTRSYPSASIFREIEPFTNDVRKIIVMEPNEIISGLHAYDFCFLDEDTNTSVAAISFPFIEEGNCSSYVILVSGNHQWENIELARAESTDTYIFARNILLTMAGVEGYEFDPCAFADSMLTPEPTTLCSITPNPFTPNGDGINDEVEFEFPGLGEVPGTIKIFTLGNLRVRTIEVPTGSGAKEAAKWDGRDDSGAPMRPGIYIYTIRAEGRIKCEGTVTLAR